MGIIIASFQMDGSSPLFRDSLTRMTSGIEMDSEHFFIKRAEMWSGPHPSKGFNSLIALRIFSLEIEKSVRKKSFKLLKQNH